MANDRDQPELPRVEPEIIPPDRAGGGSGRRRAAWPPYEQRETTGVHRVYVTRIGPFGFAMLSLAFAILAAAILLVFAGAILLWLPVVALLIVVAAVFRFFRG
jgi:hypothetical protein